MLFQFIRDTLRPLSEFIPITASTAVKTATVSGKNLGSRVVSLPKNPVPIDTLPLESKVYIQAADGKFRCVEEGQETTYTLQLSGNLLPADQQIAVNHFDIGYLMSPSPPLPPPPPGQLMPPPPTQPQPQACAEEKSQFGSGRGRGKRTGSAASTDPNLIDVPAATADHTTPRVQKPTPTAFAPPAAAAAAAHAVGVGKRGCVLPRPTAVHPQGDVRRQELLSQRRFLHLIMGDMEDLLRSVRNRLLKIERKLSLPDSSDEEDEEEEEEGRAGGVGRDQRKRGVTPPSPPQPARIKDAKKCKTS